MKKRSLIIIAIAFLVVIGIYAFSQDSSGQTQSDSQYSTGQSQSDGSSQSSGRTIQYYLQEAGDIEWVVIPPEQLDSSQTYWLEYPAGLEMNSDGSTNMAGNWERVSSNLVVFMPGSTLSYSSSSTYNVSAAQAETAYMQEEANVQNAPDYAQPGYEDPCSISDCVDPSTVSGNSDTSEP